MKNEQIEGFKENLAQLLEQYKNSPITNTLIRHMKGRVMALIAYSLNPIRGGDLSRESLNFCFEQGKDINTMYLKAKNLFTLLVLNGVYVPPFILGDSESYETEDGRYICQYLKDSDEYLNVFIPITQLKNFYYNE